MKRISRSVIASLKYKAMAGAIAPQFINGVRQEKKTYFLINHQASGLTPPDKSNIPGITRN